MLTEERELNATLNDPSVGDARKDEASNRLGEVHQILLDIDAATGPTRAAELLYGLGFSETDMVRPRLARRELTPPAQNDQVSVRRCVALFYRSC